MSTKVIGTLGIIDNIVTGGRTITSVPAPGNTSSGLLTLIATITSNNYSTMRLVNGTSGYQVTSGKTLTIVAAQLITGANGSATSYVNIGYGTTDVGINSNSAPSTPVYIGGNIAQYLFALQYPGSFECAPNFQVIASNYPFLYTNATDEQAILCYGFEA